MSRLLAALVARTNKLAQPQAAAYAAANMVNRVSITRGEETVFDPQTGRSSRQASETVYVGVARESGASGAATLSVGDEPTYYSSTSVSVPLGSCQPQVDDVVTFLNHVDPLMLGRQFRVEDVQTGSQLPNVIRMRCTGIQPSKQWER